MYFKTSKNQYIFLKPIVSIDTDIGKRHNETSNKTQIRVIYKDIIF